MLNLTGIHFTFLDYILVFVITTTAKKEAKRTPCPAYSENLKEPSPSFKLKKKSFGDFSITRKLIFSKPYQISHLKCVLFGDISENVHGNNKTFSVGYR